MPDGSNLILGSEGTPAWKANNTSNAATRVDRDGAQSVTALAIENFNGPAILAVAHAKAGVAGTVGVEAISASGAGVQGTSIEAPGVAGRSETGAGVQGTSIDAPGVVGLARGAAGVSGTASALGVHGKSDRIGVKGEGSIGVQGLGSTGVKGEGSIGVHGVSDVFGVLGDAPKGTGVWGTGRVGVLGASSAGDGVLGNSSTGTGVKGESSFIAVDGISFGSTFPHAGVRGVSLGNGAGVWGRSDKASVSRVGGGLTTVGAGVFAQSPKGTGLVATTGAATGLAGAFVGDVAIAGNVFIFGNATVTGAKAAAVPHPDGSLRLTFAVEAPESFFEDFGRGRIVRGRARVKIDRDFAVLVDRDEYYVFLTPEGECQGLYVSSRGRDSFEVREQQGGRSTVAFSYRLVSRRKDVSRGRLPKAPVRSLSAEGLPPVDEIPKPPVKWKAPRLPNPLKDIDRLAGGAKTRALTRQRKRGKAAKKG